MLKPCRFQYSCSIKKGNFSVAQVFSCDFCKILRTPFLQNTSGRLLLYKEIVLHVITVCIIVLCYEQSVCLQST